MSSVYLENFNLNLIDETDEYYQSRLDYNPEEIQALAEDIQKFGQRNPVGIEKKGEKYRIIYGFQRVKALKLLKKETIKALFYEGLTQEEAQIHSISDNIRHGDLTDLEKALKCKQLQKNGFDIDKLCETFGVKKSIIYNYLSISDLDEPTRDCLQIGLISLNHAVELARLPDSKRLEILKPTISYRFSVRELKNYIYSGQSPVIWLCLDGWVSICPKHLRYIPLTKIDPEKYKDHKFKPPDEPYNCSTCENHLCTPEEKLILCSYNYLEYSPGIIKLLEYSGWGIKGAALRSEGGAPEGVGGDLPRGEAN